MKRFTHQPANIPRAALTKGHRYRTPTGIEYPSVTTVLGATKPAEEIAGLERWKASVGADVANYILRESAIIGTQAHRLNERYLDMVDGGDARLLAKAHHANFRPHLDRIDNIRGNEIPMYSDMLELAGTADCIAEYDGTLSVIDYKTKRSPQQPDWLTDYYQQTAAYCIMFKEHTGITINQCVILVSSEKGTMQEFYSNPFDHAQGFLERLAQYDRCRREMLAA